MRCDPIQRHSPGPSACYKEVPPGYHPGLILRRIDMDYRTDNRSETLKCSSSAVLDSQPSLEMYVCVLGDMLNFKMKLNSVCQFFEDCREQGCLELSRKCYRLPQP